MKRLFSTERSKALRAAVFATFRHRLVREVLILLVFFAITAVMTWPWITRVRDAVADEGDPYMIAWTLWWDYHQTFTDPLNLFHANVFYPYKYTLAFSEHDYGIAIIFFPLFALGLRPLAVQSFATFCGFAFSGYGQFRLTRTLTRSSGAAWIAGIIFAFVPYRFHLLSHLHYLFAGWLPLLLEALVLFARQRLWRRAAWLGIAFVMNALTCTSYFILALVPLGLSLAFLVLNYRIERDRDFWLRGAAALGFASVALLPFMLPYYFVMKLYGFMRSADEVAVNSPTPMNWLVAEGRNKLWRGFGNAIPNSRHKLFPGLLPMLLALFTFLPLGNKADHNEPQTADRSQKKLLRVVDGTALLGLIVAVLAAGYQGTGHRVFGVRIYEVVTSARALFVCLLALILRLALAYPRILSSVRQKNLIESIRSASRGDAFALGLIWMICGFLGSLGMNFFLNRALYDFVPLFRAIRIPSHWAMIAYVGLALLAGLGTQRLAERLKNCRPRAHPAFLFAVIAIALSFELHAFPLAFVRGKADPDQITLRLKQITMRGGIVELPHDLGMALPHRYMLRAADHEKPLINATSSFVSPLTWQIQSATQSGPIPENFIDLLEGIPASYLVIHTADIPPERRADYGALLARAVATGRLRFINRFDGRDDLYAVVKTEPETKSEAPLPFAFEAKQWSEMIKEDPGNLLGQFRPWSEAVYRLYLASFGEIPRYTEFLRDLESVGQNVMIGFGDEQSKLAVNLRQFANDWVERARFQAVYKTLSNAEYVDALITNAGITRDPAARAGFVDQLDRGELSRAEVLLDIVNSQPFIEKQKVRSLVLFHYFGYLHRNPADPPDKNLEGFNFWIRQMETSGNNAGLTNAFMTSFEYEGLQKKATSEKK